MVFGDTLVRTYQQQVWDTPPIRLELKLFQIHHIKFHCHARLISATVPPKYADWPEFKIKRGGSWILPWILIFGQKCDSWTIFEKQTIVNKIYISEKNIRLLNKTPSSKNIRFLTKLGFWTKFGVLNKIWILTKFGFLNKIWIFEQNFCFWLKIGLKVCPVFKPKTNTFPPRSFTSLGQPF